MAPLRTTIKIMGDNKTILKPYLEYIILIVTPIVKAITDIVYKISS
jgi:hypothetical protein